MNLTPSRERAKVSYKSDDMTDSLRRALGELGLGAHEARLYSLLLAHGPASAASLAKRSGVARSSVYTALAALVDRGLVATTHQDEVKRFVPTGHDALVEAMRREQERARTRVSLAETLRAHFAAPEGDSTGAPRVIHFEGATGLRRIFMAMLRAAPKGSTLKVLRDEFIWTDAWSFVFEDPWRDRVRALKVERALRTRLLVNRSPEERRRMRAHGSRPHLDVRFLPAQSAVRDFALYIAGDMVSVLSLEAGNLVGIQMTDRLLARNFDVLYGALWACASASPPASRTGTQRASGPEAHSPPGQHTRPAAHDPPTG